MDMTFETQFTECSGCSEPTVLEGGFPEPARLIVGSSGRVSYKNRTVLAKDQRGVTHTAAARWHKGLWLFPTFACLVASAGLVGGCKTHPPEGSIKATTNELDELHKKTAQSPIVERKADFYVDAEPLGLEEREPWLRSPVTINARDLPFSVVVDRVMKDIAPGHVASYALDMEVGRTVNLTYTGSVHGLFEQLARLTGFRYEVKEGRPLWTEFVTRSFDLMAASGGESFRLGREDASTSGGSGGALSTPATGSTGTTGTPGTVAVTGGGNTSEYVNRLAKDTLWADVEKSVKALLSDKGTLMVAASIGTVTVRDRADRVDLVQALMDGINHNLGAQVLIRVRILEITLSKEFQYGIDWTAVMARAEGTFTLSTVAGLPTPTLGGTPASLLFQITNPSSKMNGSSAIVQALGSQGDVAVVTQPDVVALNNRVSEVKLQNQTSYLQSVTVTTTANVGSQSSLTPGLVIDGFSMYLLPRIVGDRVVLTVSSNISTLEGITSVSSGGSTIQTPELMTKEVYQNAIMSSGETLVLTGFRQLRETRNDQKFLGLSALGSQSGDKQRTELLLMITPIVLGGKAT
jgi:type IVB pilus formation R64 PilN family outer membrane protein